MATPSPLKAALILPALEVRNNFARSIRQQCPGIDLHICDPSPPGAVPEELLHADIFFTFGQFLNDEILAQAQKLQWIQGLGSGVDGITDRSTLAPDVIVTNARGVHSICVSETAIALMLAMARDVPGLVRAQAARLWATGPARLLYGKTAGIVGVGLIAEGLASRCKAFGMLVEGVSSRRSAPGFDVIHPYADLVRIASRLDYLVLLAPLSDATRNIVNRDVLQALRPDAFLINVARGGVVDEAALAESLASGGIAGAALDVFAIEPLPEDSLFWDMPNLLISPHTAGQHHNYAEHVMTIVTPNVHAFCTGQIDSLINRVNRTPQNIRP